MKKLLVLLLIAPVLGFGQVLTDVLYLSGVNINPGYIGNDGSVGRTYQTSSGTIADTDPFDERVVKYTVPEGKFWKIIEFYYGDISEGRNYIQFNNLHQCVNCFSLVFENEPNNGLLPNDFNHTTEEIGLLNLFTRYRMNSNVFIKGGLTFWVSHNSDNSYNAFAYTMIIEEYEFSNNSLSYNEPETIKNNSNAPVLFPNPTSSLLALNSDKEYDIEVYDMAGNKVMALTGNTIDMSHLSSATYIVKALDKVDNEEVSYKVVKN